MQYVLTEDEYKNLIDRPTLQQFSKLLDDVEKAGDILKPLLGCWRLREPNYGYCDDCPLAENRTVCKEHREYSK